jgi:hypothetical protein
MTATKEPARTIRETIEQNLMADAVTLRIYEAVLSTPREGEKLTKRTCDRLAFEIAKRFDLDQGAVRCTGERPAYAPHNYDITVACEAIGIGWGNRMVLTLNIDDDGHYTPPEDGGRVKVWLDAARYRQVQREVLLSEEVTLLRWIELGNDLIHAWQQWSTRGPLYSDCPDIYAIEAMLPVQRGKVDLTEWFSLRGEQRSM